MRGRRCQLFPTTALLGVLLAVLGCERNPYEDGRLSDEDLPASGLVPAGGWESAPFPTPQECDGDAGAMRDEALTWPELAGREKLEVPHDLGRTPAIVLVYLAFQESGCSGTLASGDVARIRGVDSERVIIQNATKEHFFLRLYLE